MPEASAGEVIDLTVNFQRKTQGRRRAGSLRGKIHFGPEFDDPIPGMEEYE